MVASYYGRVDLQLLLLQHGANPNETDVGKQTALHLACAGVVDGESSAAALELLLAHGADASRQDEHGCTALMRCADWGDSSTVKVLLGSASRRVSINVVDNEGRNALWHAAAAASDEQICRLLLQAGADFLCAAAANGLTPADVTQSPAVARLLEVRLRGRAYRIYATGRFGL
jgi:ankyrin repeat protein